MNPQTTSRGISNGNGQESNEEASKKSSGGYPFGQIEAKWQAYWRENKTFRTPDEIDMTKPKFYCLDMFPYPRQVVYIINFG